MMDASPLSDVPFHPGEPDQRLDYTGDWKPTRRRTRAPVKYYIIDFGLSRRYEPAELPAREQEIRGADPSPPEFQTDEEFFDPFPTDIYYIGNMVRTDFFLVGTCLHFLFNPLNL
jgi:hypothetical protein